MLRLAIRSAVVAGLLLLSSTPLHAIILDPTFGTGGITRLQVNGEGLRGAVVQPDGKTVAVGDVGYYPNRVLELVRWDDDGVLDPTFGTGGIALHTLGGGHDCQPSDLVLLPDGKLLVASLVATAPDTYTTALVRFLSNGALDTDFGVNGIVVAGAASIRTLELLPDGNVLAGGAIAGGTPGNNLDFGITKYLADGTVDGAFGMVGIARGDVTYLEYVFDIALRPNGGFVVTGQVNGPPPDYVADFGVAAFLADGTLDPTFGSGGVVLTVLPDSNYGHSVASLTDGGVVLAGLTNAGSNAEFTLARYDGGGVLDPTFGTGGVARYDYGASADVIEDAVLVANGDIVVAGYTTGTGYGAGRPTLARFKTNGTLQTSFGTGGVYRFLAGDEDVFSGDFDRVFRLPDGRLLAAGTVNDTSGNSDFTLVRFIDNVCGNGVVEFSESCDDGNVASGDCCSATCQLEAQGSPCGADGLRCTKDECDGAGACTHPPNIRPSCRHTAAVGGAQLRIDDRPGTAKDALSWKLAKGEHVGFGELGDPRSVNAYTLCGFEYASSASGALLFELEAPAGGTCSGAPCWKATSTGYRYRSRDSADGTFKVKVASGAHARTRFAFAAKGAQLATPALPAPVPLRVQLQAQGGVCIEATFDTPIFNVAGAFRARGQ